MRRKQALASLAVALLLVTAGCAGFTGGDGSTPESDTTTTPNGTSTPAEDLDTPPGIQDGEITNSTALYEAHSEAVNNTARSVHMSTSETADGQTTERNVSVTYGQNDSLLMEMDTAEGQQNVYQNNGLTVMDSEGQTVVAQGESMASQMAGLQSEQLEAILIGLPLQVGNYSQAGTTTHDGTTVHKFTADLDSMNQSAASGMENVTAFDATVLVSPDGVIHKVTMDITEDTENGERDVSTSYELSNFGDATVESPDWSSDIPQPKAELVNDGETLKITNVGESTIESGAELTVSTGGSRAAVTLENSVAPGESVYLTGTASDGGLSGIEQHDSAAVGEYNFGDSPQTVVTGQIGDATIQLRILPSE